MSSIIQNITIRRLERISPTRQLISTAPVIYRDISSVGKCSVAFNYEDVTAGSKAIGSIPANKRVYKVTLEIIDAFESILINVGDADAHGRLLWSAQNNPEAPGFYYSLAEVDYAALTQLLIYFTGSSATGSGTITIYYS